jgi:intron-binding protein aquarius
VFLFIVTEGCTCTLSSSTWLLHVYSCWERFLASFAENEDKPKFFKDRFPFKELFSNTPHPIFTCELFERDMRAAKGCFHHLKTMFQELEECKAFDLLKSKAD